MTDSSSYRRTSFEAGLDPYQKHDQPMRYERMFDRHGVDYGSEWTIDSLDSFANSILLTPTIGSLAGTKDQKRALDLGCGTGYRARGLAQLGAFGEIYAVDQRLHPGIIAEETERLGLQESDSKIIYKEGNILDFFLADLGGKPFDFINFRNVLHFLAPQDARKLLQNIKKFAAPGALVVMSFDAHNDVLPSIDITKDIPDFYADMGSLVFEQAPFTPYSAPRVIAYMRELGFEIMPNIGGIIDSSSRSYQECRLLLLAPTF